MTNFSFYRIVFIVLTAALSSCTNTLYTSIEVLKPARVTFPKSVNSVLIVNNAPIQPENLGHKTELFNQNPQNPAIKTDSLGIFCVSSFAETLAEKDFFNRVETSPINQNNLDFKLSPQPMTMEKATELCKNYNTDAVISLNRILVNDLQAELFNETKNTYISFLEAKYDLHWTIYVPENTRMGSITTRDTLYWESEAFNRKKAIAGLPDRQNALIDGAILSGESSVNHFIPKWEKVDRYFFNFNSGMYKKGIDKIYYQSWEDAIQIFDSLYLITRNDYKKMKLANNLSVLYEMKGQIDKAIEFAESALTIVNDLPIMDYNSYWVISNRYEEIQNRKEEISKVRDQLGN